jgi:hypothetical protein
MASYKGGTVATLALLVGFAVGCGGGETETVTEQEPKTGGFSYKQVEALSERTCGAVPRVVLARSLARESSDPGVGGTGDPAQFDDNAVALLYVEDIAIRPIALQTAAYDGCMAGLSD